MVQCAHCVILKFDCHNQSSNCLAHHVCHIICFLRVCRFVIIKGLPRTSALDDPSTGFVVNDTRTFPSSVRITYQPSISSIDTSTALSPVPSSLYVWGFSQCGDIYLFVPASHVLFLRHLYSFLGLGMTSTYLKFKSNSSSYGAFAYRVVHARACLYVCMYVSVFLSV
jgi:hypothetical protein